MKKETIFSKLTSFSDIVQTMVNGVNKEWVKVSMTSFGKVQAKRIFGFDIPFTDKCYGCAATNTLCELMQSPFKVDEIRDMETRAKRVNYGIETRELYIFETAIDSLRLGNITGCIYDLGRIKHLFSFDIPTYDKVRDYDLPSLDNINYKAELHNYQTLVENLKSKGL